MTSPRLLQWFCIWCTFAAHAARVPLFDGQSLAGWEGETNQVWRVRDGAIVGGSLQGNPRNEFLATRGRYKNFRLTLEYKLVGTEGFVNGGVQFRSERVATPPNEMAGYQADIGAGYSGSLYDESRRNKVLVQADTNLISRIEKPGDWNSYEIVARGDEIELILNGQRTVSFLERDPAIAADGVVALQIHGNCKAEISFRNLFIEELPTPNVPTETQILSRFGGGQPGVPLAAFPDRRFILTTNEVIAFVGQENFVRDQKAGEIEAQLAAIFSREQPRVRPMAWEADTVYEQWRDLNFGSWLRQLEAAEATAVIAQFGQMEALDGAARLPEFTAAYHRLLDQFALRTKRLVLVSPMPFEKPVASHAPDLSQRNDDVALYVEAVREVARARGAVFIDLFGPLTKRPSKTRLTRDGTHLTEVGLREVAEIIGAQLGAVTLARDSNQALREAIVEKNRLWFDSWRPANWSFVYGDRVAQLYGKGLGEEPSLHASFENHRPLIAAADRRIHALARGDSAPPLPIAPSAASTPQPKVMTPVEQLATLLPAEGYEVNLFASEHEGVVKPTQISWDERGRLYVACSPTYPQSRASAKPADYILVLEDSDLDGKADRSTRFAEGLTMVQGVEPGDGGVFVCDFDQLLHFTDTDGDGRADVRRVVFSGFGIGDTHQLINSITHGPDGSLWFTQGLHAFSRVETPWGIARLDRSAVWRLRPRTLRLEGFFGGGMAGANCWGVAFDDFGQVFHKSGDRPQGYWTVPGLQRGASPFVGGSASAAEITYANVPEQYHSVGPLFDTSPKTTALDIIGTSALPDELQGCALIGGYFGGVVEAHRFEDAGSGFKTTQLPRLLKSSDNSFRPVDVSVGPDGAIYLADWFNPVIGHYQVSYADPARDKNHGRIWRLSAKGRAPVRQPNLAAMRPAELLEQLSSKERWTRYQAKKILFYAPSAEVIAAADDWLAKLNSAPSDNEQLMLEVAGVFSAHETVRPELLHRILKAKDARVRAYGARTIGAWAGQLPEALALLNQAVRDENPRVRLEAVVASTYVPKAEAVEVVMQALEQPRDPFLDYAIRQSARALMPQWAEPFAQGKLDLNGSEVQATYLKNLRGAPTRKAAPGQEIYDMACLPCHQPEGKGLPGVYPPLAGSEWVQGDAETLIKIVLHGLQGPIVVNGKSYGTGEALPMPAMAGLTDQQIAEVLSFVRNEFGKGSAAVTSETVGRVRKATESRTSPWTAQELKHRAP